MALSASERSKLAKVLGMLGSDHAGERQNAGLAANRIVKDAGLSWEQVLEAQEARADRRDPPRPKASQGQPNFRDDLGFCRRHQANLNPWEQQFFHSVAMRRKPPSAGQIRKLAEIASELRGRGFV